MRPVWGHVTLGPVMRGLEGADACAEGIRIEDDDADHGAARRVEIDLNLRNAERVGRLGDDLQPRAEVRRSVTWLDGRRSG